MVHRVCQKFVIVSGVCLEDSVTLKRNFYDTSSGNKAAMWRVFMWKKQQLR